MSDSYFRTIRSFDKREGRFTKGQQRAFSEQWPKVGLSIEQGMLDFQPLFGRKAPLVLEIGFGMGDSLVQMAKDNPCQDYIGIEVHRPGVGALLLGMEEQQLTNLRVFNDDAVEVLKHCILDNSLARVQLFFPDPWHKTRHHKRRIVQADFVQMLCQKLQPGGVFHMATDWQNYAEHMLAVMQAADGWKNCADHDYMPRPEQRPVTKFEKRGHRLGHGVWDLMFQKN